MTPFLEDESYTEKQYIARAPWDEIQFSYEVLGESTISLSQRYLIPTYILNDMAEAAGWTDHNKLSVAEINDKTNEYYKRSRMALTAKLSERSQHVYDRITSLEDRYLKQIEETLEEYEKMDGVKPDTMDLQRLGNMLSKTITQYKLLEEAIIAPAQSDRKAIAEDGNMSLTELFESIDQEGRELPGDGDAQTKG